MRESSNTATGNSTVIIAKNFEEVLADFILQHLTGACLAAVIKSLIELKHNIEEIRVT